MHALVAKGVQVTLGKLKDYIDDCMNDTGVEASIPEFMQAFCSRCLNPDCKRSKINDLQWQQRMDRQLKALNNPEFADPSDPNFQPLANQDFQSFDKQQVKASTWESFSEPQHFEDTKPPEKDPIIHRADPPSESRDSRKIDDSVNRLATAKGKEPQNKERESDVEEPEVIEDTPKEEVEIRESPERDQEKRQRPERKVAKPKRNQYNTDVPDGGILLKPQEEVLKPSQRDQKPARDKWAVPDDNDGPLVVRASDGKRVKKKSTDVDNDRNDKYKGRSKSEEKD